MTTHTLHADEDPRDCPHRFDTPNGPKHAHNCGECGGTGRLGDEHAEKVIEVWSEPLPMGGVVFKAAKIRRLSGEMAPGVGATEKQALDAARLALGGRIG